MLCNLNHCYYSFESSLARLFRHLLKNAHLSFSDFIVLFVYSDCTDIFIARWSGRTERTQGPFQRCVFSDWQDYRASLTVQHRTLLTEGPSLLLLSPPSPTIIKTPLPGNSPTQWRRLLDDFSARKSGR